MKDPPAPHHSHARSGRLHEGLRLLVLGDSIAYGTGARRAEDTLGRRLATALATEGFDVDLHVLAVPGAVSAGLAAQVRRAEALGPGLAVIVIGANDLARFVPPAQAVASLADAVAALRRASTDVLVVPAPDMSAVPFVPPALRPAVQAASALLQRLQTSAVEAAGGVVAADAVEVGRAFAGDPAMFSGDRFHPSSAGYAHIAAALTPHVLKAARDRRDAAA
jgi:lysophospholipase L1-like esterase